MLWYVCLNFVVLTTLYHLTCANTGTFSHEKRLIRGLLDSYQILGVVGRPVNHTDQTVHVRYGLQLTQILNLEGKDQVLTTNCWNKYEWNDIFLRWNPEDYGGITNLRIPTNLIWTPDIILYNYADDRLQERREIFAVVQHTGDILWIPPAVFRSTCSIESERFPYDLQTCELKFGSWTFDGNKLDLDFINDSAQIDLSDYKQSNEWVIESSPAKKDILFFPCCSEPYPYLTFQLNIRRSASFYNYIIILPCILLSSLTLVLFWLPPEAPAKMVLGMNIYVAFFVLLLILANSTPPSATSIPIIGAYFCLNMIMITMSTFLSVIVMNAYFRGDMKNRVPLWMRKVFLNLLARFLRMSSPLGERRLSSKKESKHKKKNRQCHNKCHSEEPTSNATDLPMNHHPPMVSQQRPPTALDSDVREIKRYIRQLIMRVQQKEDKGRVMLEWRQVALVMDRVFFIIYLMAIVTSLLTITLKFQ